jgi:hypothetical protein
MLSIPMTAPKLRRYASLIGKPAAETQDTPAATLQEPDPV